MSVQIEMVVSEISDVYGEGAVREALRREEDARRAGRMEQSQRMVMAAILLCRKN